MEVSNSDGNILITGFWDPVRDLFIVPINDHAEEQRVKETTCFVGATSQWIGTDYNGVVRPILLPSEQHTAANAYAITNIPSLVSYLHACAGFLVIATYIYAINKG